MPGDPVLTKLCITTSAATLHSTSPATNAIVSNDNYPGYFLGLADVYSQGSAQREGVRNTGLYLFAQDGWKIKSNLTFNYGLRWELDTPLTRPQLLGHVQTFRPGETSTMYPCTNSLRLLSYGASGSR